MDKYEIAVEKGVDLLRSRHRDKAHDLKHHQLVWSNCEHLIAREKIRVNKKLLKIAAYWHDVIIEESKWPSSINLKETCDHLYKLLSDLEFSIVEKKTVIDAIKHHEFRDTPTNIEGLVLQDADKLEVVSFKRWGHTIKEYKDGNIKKESMVSYLKTFLKWSVILPSTFYFSESRRIAKSNLSELTTNPKWLNVFKDFGLEEEFNESVKLKRSPKILLLNCWIRVKSEFIKLLVLARPNKA